jgi:copper transport protein
MRAYLALVAALVAALAAARAEAHAELVAADPTAGSVVAVAPATATLSFSEPVAPLALRWFRSGAAAIEVQGRGDGDRLVVPLPPGQAAGTLVLSWRVVSADGHPVAGSHVFSVGAPSDVRAVPTAPTAVPAAIAHGFLTVALAFGVGGAVFLRLVDAGPSPPRAGRIACLCAAVSPPLAVIACGFHGLDLTGSPPAALLDADPWRAVLGNRFAASAAASVLAALLALAALRHAGAAAAVLAAAGWALAAAGFALFGHAASAPPRWLAAPAMAVHAAAFLFWIGALPALAEAAVTPGPSLTSRLRRFSSVAIPLVTLLVATGTALSVIQLGALPALVDTAYGRLLAAKLAAVALLLALAAGNRLRLTPAIAAGRGGAARQFHRSVLAEIALALLILALASGFRLAPPPRLAARPPAPAHAHLHGAGLMAAISVARNNRGSDTVEITFLPPVDSHLAPKEVRVAFSDPVNGVEPIRLTASGADTRWRAGPVLLPYSGTWALAVDVVIDDFSAQSLRGTIDIGLRSGSRP